VHATSSVDRYVPPPELPPGTEDWIARAEQIKRIGFEIFARASRDLVLDGRESRLAEIRSEIEGAVEKASLLFEELGKGRTITEAASGLGISEQAAAKWRSGILPNALARWEPGLRAALSNEIRIPTQRSPDFAYILGLHAGKTACGTAVQRFELFLSEVGMTSEPDAEALRLLIASKKWPPEYSRTDYGAVIEAVHGQVADVATARDIHVRTAQRWRLGGSPPTEIARYDKIESLRAELGRPDLETVGYAYRTLGATIEHARFRASKFDLKSIREGHLAFASAGIPTTGDDAILLASPDDASERIREDRRDLRVLLDLAERRAELPDPALVADRELSCLETILPGFDAAPYSTSRIYNGAETCSSRRPTRSPKIACSARAA
jgi:hypothetical protein